MTVVITRLRYQTLMDDDDDDDDDEDDVGVESGYIFSAKVIYSLPIRT